MSYATHSESFKNLEPGKVYPVKGLSDDQILIKPGVRYPIEYLVKRWISGERAPLNSLLKAFEKIKKLPRFDERSYFWIAGSHGRPMLTRTDLPTYKYWGKFCQHGNVLFPLWHRAYVCHMEKALQSMIPEDEFKPMIAFWDEISTESKEHGVPEIFTADTVWIDDVPTENPLKTYKFPMQWLDDQPPVGKDSVEYGDFEYEVVRYPFFHSHISTKNSELAVAANELNKRYVDSGVQALNDNVKGWLNGPPPKLDIKRKRDNIDTTTRYINCLQAPNYTLFSNTTSMRAYAKEHPSSTLWSLEQPHNDIHLALGSHSPPYLPDEKRQNAYGDMGYNEVAAFDPIFYFHHSFIDRMFWFWQELHESTKELTVVQGPGTSTSDEQGPTPGFGPDEQLSLKSPLYPFINKEVNKYLTGEDIIDIGPLNYSYEGGTQIEELLQYQKLRNIEEPGPRKMILVTNVDRAIISGPFVVIVNIIVEEEAHFVGYDTVFNKMRAETCPNCMITQFMDFVFPLDHVQKHVRFHKEAKIKVSVHGSVRPGKTLNYTAEFVD